MKKINNLNEQLNRMKSLMGDGRLYGNLVDKKPINEWRLIGQLAKNSDEALEVFAKAEKYWDDAVKSGKATKVPSMIDDVVKSSGQGSFETILNTFSRNLDTVDDMVKHMDEFDDVYKAILNPKQYDSYKSFIKFASENGIENLDIVRGLEDGSPYFMRFPAELNLRWVIFAQWFKKQPNAVKKEVVELLKGTPTDKIVGDVPIKGSLLDDLAKTTGNSADEVIDAVKAGDDVVDDIIKTGDDVVDDIIKTGDDVVKTSSKEGGLWGEEIFIMFKDGKLSREDALLLLKDDREAMERFLTLSKGSGDDIGGTIGKTGDDVGDTIGKTGDDIGGTIGRSADDVGTMLIKNYDDFVKRVDDIIADGYVGELKIQLENGAEYVIKVGSKQNGSDVVELWLKDITKGMSRREKRIFLKENSLNIKKLKDAVNDEYADWSTAKKWGAFMLGKFDPLLKNKVGRSLDYFVGADAGTTKMEKLFGLGTAIPERLLKMNFVTIGPLAGLVYTIKDSELTHPFFINTGGYYGKIMRDSGISAVANWIMGAGAKVAWKDFCKTTKEATSKIFDCSIIEGEIYLYYKEVLNDPNFCIEGGTEEDYKKALIEKLSKNSALRGVIKKSFRDKTSKDNWEDYEQLVENKLLEAWKDHIPEGVGYSKETQRLVNAKIAKCNNKELKNKSRDRGGNGGVTWEDQRNKGTGGTEDGGDSKRNRSDRGTG